MRITINHYHSPLILVALHTWYWVDGAYDKLCHDLSDPLPSHGDPPVVSAVINHKKLSGGQKDVNYHLCLHSFLFALPIQV